MVPNNTAIYIHIPFCDHRCIYCDFYSLISYDNIDEYLKYLKKEIKHYSALYSQNRIIDTIFFGGGTPSLMEPVYIHQIIESIKKSFSVVDDVEITLETNPGTVTKTILSDFKHFGVDRISIGIQSFNETELKFLTRIHDKKTAINTVHKAKEAGFNNISIDLIFSLPNQSRKIWEENLNIAVDLPIQHISAYSLILERGTILNKMVLDGKVSMPTENHDSELYQFTMDYLSKNSFEQYEVSNFAKTGYECKHNLNYWNHNDYLSFGTGAHSFVNGKRWWNYSSLKKYIYEVEQNEHAVRGSEVLNNAQIFDEFVMLGLRSKGINLKKVFEYNKNWYFEKTEIINSFIKESYLTEDRGIIKCTAKGYLICDELISQLL